MKLHSYLLSFKPHSTPIARAEKLRSGIAGGIAVLLLALTLHYLPQHEYPLLLLTPMASSAALLYVAPHSPFSQPWNFVGGHFASALCGWACSWYIPDPAIAGGLAVGIAISLMYFLKCMHPPAAATALVMVLHGGQLHSMGWQWISWIVLANVGISLLLALIINSAIPGRRYPVATSLSPASGTGREIAATQADIEWALTQMDSVIDVSIEDLTDIYARAAQHASERRNMAGKQHPDAALVAPKSDIG